MALFNSVWTRVCTFFRPNLRVEVYSHKTRQWVTVSVPGGRRDLIEAELQRFEDIQLATPELQQPAEPVIPKSPMKPIDERNEWIRNVKMALKISAMKRSEYIALLGSDYDSLEALLTITVPVYNDPISPTMGPYIEGLERDGLYYYAASEIEFVVRLGDDLDAKLMLGAIRNEASSRNLKKFARSKGYCCGKAFIEHELCEAEFRGACCEKATPEEWELNT